MSVFLLGESGLPFDRTFFHISLENYLGDGKAKSGQNLRLHLTDGNVLDVCQIEELSGVYMSVRAYSGEDEGCELTLQLIPYGLIYKIEISPKSTDDKKVGFTWTKPEKSSTRSRRSGS